MAEQGGAQVVGNQVVGNIGMYYAAYRLSQQGWNVMPTARNARGVDLLVYDVSAHTYDGGWSRVAGKSSQRGGLARHGGCQSGRDRAAARPVEIIGMRRCVAG